MARSNQADSRSTTTQRKGPGPEKKFGPFEGGVSVAVWLNTIQTDDGPREVRSVTISPRRYRDAESGEWRDSGSFRLSDLPALVFALQKALAYDYMNPLRGQKQQEDAYEGQ